MGVMFALWGRAALACGGFFCDQVDPIEQSAERILFRQDGPEQWTTIVEVQFQGPPGDFGWVIPIPEAIDPQTEITLAPAGLFDALEAVAAPLLQSPASADALALYRGSAGCESGCDSAPALLPDTSGVEVVGEAVVGPYDLELLSAGEGDNLVSWLQGAGYQIPFSASPLFSDYIARGYSFLGVKLRPDVPSGPIEALVLSCASDLPTIPLRLTSIAAVPDMEIVAYVLARERYRPAHKSREVDIDPSLLQEGEGFRESYLSALALAVDEASGRGWRTESAMPASSFVASLPDDIALALGQGAYLTRLRTVLSPEEMLIDPAFVPFPEGGDVSRILSVEIPERSSAALLAPLGLAAGILLRRRGASGPL